MRVIVVGAGPAGAALALLLARAGCSVTLLERETEFGRVFRGEGLMPLGGVWAPASRPSHGLLALPALVNVVNWVRPSKSSVFFGDGCGSRGSELQCPF